MECAIISSLMVMAGVEGKDGGSERMRRRGGAGSNDDDDLGPDPFLLSRFSASDACRFVPSMFLFSDLVMEEENRRRIVRIVHPPAREPRRRGAAREQRVLLEDYSRAEAEADPLGRGGSTMRITSPS